MQHSPPTSASEPADGKVTQAEAAAMLRAVFNLFRLWRVNDAQAMVLLGEASPLNFDRSKRGESGMIPDDMVCRLGDLLAIHKAVRRLFAEPGRAYAWMSKPNDAFSGRSALEQMLGGARSDLAAVRAYLEAETAGADHD